MQGAGISCACVMSNYDSTNVRKRSRRIVPSVRRLQSGAKTATTIALLITFGPPNHSRANGNASEIRSLVFARSDFVKMHYARRQCRSQLHPRDPSEQLEAREWGVPRRRRFP